MDESQNRSLVLDVRRHLPVDLWTDVQEFIDKDVLHVKLTYVPNGRLFDLGGGYSSISAVLSRLGMDVTVVDTFASTKFYQEFSAAALCEVLAVSAGSWSRRTCESTIPQRRSNRRRSIRSIVSPLRALACATTFTQSGKQLLLPKREAEH